ncbi:sialidase family protein [Fontivita pretiosa]|uniref:sialidase family protein n=1 Tax=Fontivita pretiosa TaxID=2989684 RepID=UPI003D1844F0
MKAGIIHSGFIYEIGTAPFPSCHAATLCEPAPGHVVAAFFGGSGEGKPDASIWTCHLRDGRWSAPVLTAEGIEPDGSRYPCWNPVLFKPRNGPMLLFYKVGPSPSKWWGMLKRSGDEGHTWSAARRVGPNLIGPAKNKPVQLESSMILVPTSVESESGWRLYFECSTDNGNTWSAMPWVEQDRSIIPKATQPTILIHSQTVLQALGRTTVGRICETWSRDGGATWSPLALTDLPNCNSGIDATTLRDGTHLLVYNHSNLEKVRYPLNVAISRDGRTWQAAAIIQDEPPGQYSYPCVIQTADGLVHIAYTFKRRTIGHVVIDPAKLEPRPIREFVCPPPGSITHRVDPTQ